MVSRWWIYGWVTPQMQLICSTVRIAREALNRLPDKTRNLTAAIVPVSTTRTAAEQDARDEDSHDVWQN